MTTYLCNTGIIPQDFTGVLRVHMISLEDFRQLATSEGVISAIGHQGTVEALATLGVPCTQARIEIKGLRVGDRLVVWQPKQRLPEGRILSATELSEIGCVCKLIEVVAISEGERYVR